MRKKIKFLFVLLLLCTGVVHAQTRVTGEVIDENNEPVIGASIQIKGTGQGTVTDIDGTFSLTRPMMGFLFFIRRNDHSGVAGEPDHECSTLTETELLDEVVCGLRYTTKKPDRCRGERECGRSGSEPTCDRYRESTSRGVARSNHHQ